MRRIYFFNTFPAQYGAAFPHHFAIFYFSFYPEIRLKLIVISQEGHRSTCNIRRELFRLSVFIAISVRRFSYYCIKLKKKSYGYTDMYF